MKKIVICSSMKNREDVRAVISDLKKSGHVGLFPNIDFVPQGEKLSMKEKEMLSREHFDAIADADAVYFMLSGGYIGTSCKIELGYAIALHKPIYFSALTGDQDVDFYAKKVVAREHVHLLPQTLEELN